MQTALETLFDAPFADDAPLDALLPAVLLVATAALPPVAVLLAGYWVRVVRRAFTDDAVIAPVDDVRGLAATGLRAATVVGAYLSVPLVTMVALSIHVGAVAPATVLSTPSLALAPSALVVQQSGGGGGLLVAAASVLVGICTIVAGYVATAGLLVYAAEDRVVAAFDVDRIGTVVGSPTFLGAVLTALFLTGVGATLGILVGQLPLVGSLATATVMFLSHVVAARTVAAGYPCDPELTWDADDRVDAGGSQRTPSSAD